MNIKLDINFKCLKTVAKLTSRQGDTSLCLTVTHNVLQSLYPGSTVGNFITTRNVLKIFPQKSAQTATCLKCQVFLL